MGSVDGVDVIALVLGEDITSFLRVLSFFLKKKEYSAESTNWGISNLRIVQCINNEHYCCLCLACSTNRSITLSNTFEPCIIIEHFPQPRFTSGSPMFYEYYPLS